MGRIRIAQIGTSRFSHGNHIWDTLQKQSDIFEVVGYAFPENERKNCPQQVAAFANSREMSVEEILSDPTIAAVAIETEEIHLTKYALMAAEAGKHIHMEKPGGTDFPAFRQLIETVKAKNLVFSTGYMYRFHPEVQAAIEKVRRGELGRIFSVSAQMDCKHSPEIAGLLENFPGGMLFFLGCHLIDLVYQLQGDPSEIIPLSCSTGLYGEAKDLGMAVFKYPNGLSYAKTACNECGGVMRRELVIRGEKGTIEVRPLELASPEGPYHIYSTSRECYDNSWYGNWSEHRCEPYDRYVAMIRNFAELIRGKENPYSYDYELHVYELLLKACGKEITE